MLKSSLALLIVLCSTLIAGGASADRVLNLQGKNLEGKNLAIRVGAISQVVIASDSVTGKHSVQFYGPRSKQGSSTCIVETPDLRTALALVETYHQASKIAKHTVSVDCVTRTGSVSSKHSSTIVAQSFTNMMN